jgi:hypothetical protein
MESKQVRLCACVLVRESSAAGANAVCCLASAPARLCIHVHQHLAQQAVITPVHVLLWRCLF